MTKVLVVATSRKTRGGITSVVKAHELGEQWKKYHCKWIETHRDGNALRKLWYLGTSLLQFTCLLPFYDIVHIHIATRQSAKRKQIFFSLAKAMHKKIIFHFHPSNERFLYEQENRILYRKLFSQADLVLVLSEQWRRWIEDSLGITENVEVLYNPCPIVNRKEDKRKNCILFAGTIIARKGYSTLISAFAKIANKHQDWIVEFAGNGEIEKAEKLVKEKNIERQVHFLGWVSGKDKEEAFQRASVYCLASDGEGFPMGVLDAWAYGVPCVVTPVGGIPDIIVNGENGLIFPVGDVDKLAYVLDLMIRDAELRQRIVAQQDIWVKGQFNIEVINKHLEDIYAKLAVK